ncbi:MAG: tetratricopeptide repeat protein [Nitrospirota bacterium]
MSDATINGPEDYLPAALLEGVPPRELYAAGGGYLKARAYPSARACLEKYLEQRPDDPAALHLLARVLYHQNTDFDKAEEYLDKAALLDPGSLTSYLETRGILLIHQAKYVRAREVFEYALSEDRQTNLRHTAALKFYLDLAKKKSDANRPHLPEPDAPKSLFFTAEHGRRRLKVRFFVLPSIIAHALILLLMMYLSTHQLPFKKDAADFTFVEVGQTGAESQAPGGAGTAGEAGAGGVAGPSEEATPVGENPQAALPAAPGEQATAAPAAPAPPQSQSGGGLELPTVPAKVSPEVRPKMAGVQMENLPAPAAPEMKEGGGGSRGAVSAKGGAEALAIEPGEIAAVDVMPGRKKLAIKEVKPELSGGDVELSRKSLTALAGGPEAAPEKRYKAAKVRYKSAIAGGTLGQSGATGGGPAWEKERLAKLEEHDFGTAKEKSAAEKDLGLTSTRLKAMAQDDIKNFQARPLKIETGNSRQGAAPGKTPGLRSLSDMADEVPAYEKMKEELGANIPSSGGQEGAAVSKMRASMGQAEVKDQPRVLSGSDRMAATMGRQTGGRQAGGRFAGSQATPGRRGLQMPGLGETGSGAKARAPGTGVARLDEKSITAPGGYGTGYANPGIISRGAGAGGRGAGPGGYAGTARGINGKALGPSGSEGGLGGLMESASRKMAGALGFGQPSSPSGPSSADLKRGGALGLASGGRSGSGRGGGASGTSGGSGSYGRGGGGGGGVRFEDAHKQSSWVSAKAPTAGYTGDTPGGITGGKRFAEGSLGVPGANRYASAARAGVTPRSADRRSVLTRGTLLAENATGPKVRIVSPGAGDTGILSQTVTGVVSDARVKKVTLTVNSDSRIISVEDGAFDATVSLFKGRNVITVMAFDMDGNVGKDSVVLDYSEPSEGAPVNIISPSNGQVFDVSEKSVIAVRGTIGDQEIKRAKLILNGNPMDIVVNRGYFEQKVALSREQNTVIVEAANGTGGVSRSQTVTVGTVNVKPKDIMVVLTWDKPHADLDLHVYSPSGGHTFYKQPNTYESKDAIPGGQLEQDAKGNFGPEVFDQGHAERGIYTVKSNYFYSGGDGDAHAKVTIILYGDNPSRKIVRVFGPHLQRDTKDGSDTWEVTRIRMPEGIFLEE